MPKRRRQGGKPAHAKRKARGAAADSGDREQLTAQKEQLQAALIELEESRNRYAELFDRAPVGYLTLDGRGRIFEINLTGSAILGQERDRLIGNLITVFANDRSDLTKLLAHLRSCRAGDADIRTLFFLKGLEEASPLAIEMLSHPLENEADRYHTALIDRTEQSRHEAALRAARDVAEKAVRAKDEFIAALSHELRTPLNPVLLIASESAANMELPADVRRDFEIIEKNVTLEARLIDDLLDLTRIIRGKMPLERRPVDINAILDDALANVRPDLGRKQIAVEVRAEPCGRAVFGDPIRLQQVFWNILRNAAKFTPEQGKLLIRSRVLAGKDAVSLSFSDSGIGMKAGEMEHIFDAFSQGDHERAKAANFGGLGLGLTISRKLVDLHSGSISAFSEGPMRGATFTVELPLMATGFAPAVAPGRNEGSPAAAPAVRRRVLLVDDHEPTRKALSHLLAIRRFDVVAVGTVAECWAAAEKETFALLISDIGLPDGDGYALMNGLRARYGLRGIALTGFGMEEDIELSRQAGFEAHLTKPVQIGVLERALANFDGLAALPS